MPAVVVVVAAAVTTGQCDSPIIYSQIEMSIVRFRHEFGAIKRAEGLLI